MLAVTRFQDPGPDFEAEAQRVVEYWGAKEGCQWMELVRNVDDDHLWAIISRWENVGAYRRSFAGYEAKMVLTPLLSRAVDEPSAYLGPDQRGFSLPA